MSDPKAIRIPIVIDVDGNIFDEKQSVVHLVKELYGRASKHQVLSSTVVVKFREGDELRMRITLLPKSQRRT